MPKRSVAALLIALALVATLSTTLSLSSGDPDLSDTTFALFEPSAESAYASARRLPVLLFQSGYGSNSTSHAPLAQAIADSGFLCVMPDRIGDLAGGPAGVAAMLAGQPPDAAVSTDGNHLLAALEWFKGSAYASRGDLSKVALMGFSMGGAEAIHAAGKLGDGCQALVVLSGSLIDGFYNIKRDELVGVVGKLTCPSLWITAEGDAMHQLMLDYFEASSTPKTLLVYDDATLDTSMAWTEQTGIWTKAMDSGGASGLGVHFGLGQVATPELVVDYEISAWLQKTLTDNGVFAPSNDPAVAWWRHG